MRLQLETWNSIDINNSNIQAIIPPGQLANLTANGVTIPRAALFPYLSTSNLPAHSIQIHVIIQPGADLNVYRELIKSYFNITDTTRHDLVAFDLADSNRPWFVRGIPTRVVEGNVTTFVITILLEMPVWRLVTTGTDTWNITATGQTDDTTTIGNLNVPPSFAITPTVTKTGGLSYRRWVPIYNNQDTAYIAPIDITNGGLDTATLTTAKMQADGDDFRVWMDGTEADRWLDAMDTANTKCWINLNLSPRKEGTTNTSIAGAGGITTITFARTKANLTFLQAMQKAVNKVVLIDDEAFIFTGVNFATWQLTGVTRTMKGTTIAAHAQPKTVRWIEHDIWILYGDSTLTAPSVNDNLKPMFSLASTNASWVYTEFIELGLPRPGSWQPEVNSTRTALSYFFTDDENDFANPATVMGLSMNNAADEQSVQQESAQLDWSLTHPAGITDVVFSGAAYRAFDTFPSIVGLQKLKDNSVWITSQAVASPISDAVWLDFGPYTVDLGGTYNTIRFTMEGTLQALASDSAMVQYDTITLTIDSTKIPTVAVGAEAGVNFFDFTLTNNDTGEYITCRTPCPVNDTLTIDCENKKVYISNGERATIGFSTERQDWLDLLPATANTLQFDDTGTNAVTIVTSHRDRTL
jgi:tail protein